jgi:hypothetical protein
MRYKKTLARLGFCAGRSYVAIGAGFPACTARNCRLKSLHGNNAIDTCDSHGFLSMHTEVPL